jgi:ribosomal protein S18 acetylase RimI-like enzyme
MYNFLLREVTDQDIPTLLVVLRTAFEEYRGRLDPPSGAHTETVENVRQKLTTDRAVVAVVDQEIAGCVFYQSENGLMYLERLAVLPLYRRRGLARALIDYVEARARVLGLSHVRLGVRVVLKDNWAYYERLGYYLVEYKAHQGYTEPTYAILEKNVAQAD